jgi:hypothetical protein
MHNANHTPLRISTQSLPMPSMPEEQKVSPEAPDDTTEIVLQKPSAPAENQGDISNKPDSDYPKGIKLVLMIVSLCASIFIVALGSYFPLRSFLF